MPPYLEQPVVWACSLLSDYLKQPAAPIPFQ